MSGAPVYPVHRVFFDRVREVRMTREQLDALRPTVLWLVSHRPTVRELEAELVKRDLAQPDQAYAVVQRVYASLRVERLVDDGFLGTESPRRWFLTAEGHEMLQMLLERAA